MRFWLLGTWTAEQRGWNFNLEVFDLLRFSLNAPPGWLKDLSNDS